MDYARTSGEKMSNILLRMRRTHSKIDALAGAAAIEKRQQMFMLW